MKKLYIYISLMLFIFSSCEKEDIPVKLPAAGVSQLQTVTLGNNYDDEVYMNLATSETYSNRLAVRELGFECGTSGNHIIINGGILMQVANTHAADFYQNININSLQWKWDTPDGSIDSTAIGEWRDTTGKSKNELYIVDRGTIVSHANRYMKLKIDSVNSDNFYIHFSALDNSGETYFTVKKNHLKNYLHFSFDNNGSIADIEPDKNNWDILFTRYRYIYYQFSPPLPYLVNGVLLNGENTFCAIDSTNTYENINYNSTKNLSFSNNHDAIGYDWKTFDRNTNKYVTKPYITYIVKTQNGIFYKLHFLDFYNSSGIKGYPKFEFARL